MNKMRWKLLAVSVSLVFYPLWIFSQDPVVYKVFNSAGKEIGWEKMLRQISEADVVFFGELHNDPIGHWLQLRLIKDVYPEQGKYLILGAEMFEADNQLVLSEYLAGHFDEKKFSEDARLWKNYPTDYKPLLDFAVNNKIPFIATNIPRRYATMVFRGGFESLNALPDESKAYIAPLPVEFDPDLPGYKSMISMAPGETAHGMNASLNLPKAQAIKDATMAWFIAQNLAEGSFFIHFNGAYHSKNHEGILWYLERYKPGLKRMTISVELQENPDTLDDSNKESADFIITVPSDMTRTY
jgi:uncharacterized iron-regulated protein